MEDISSYFEISASTGDEVVGSLSKSQLVSMYGDSIYRFCLRLAYRREDADDLFQDTYIKVFSQIDKVNGSENPKGFLFSTAAYLWKSNQRKYARRHRLAPEVDLDEDCDCSTASVEDEYITKEELRMVRDLVRALPEKLKVPVILYYTAEMSLADIATSLKLPVGTVKTYLFKARNTIKKGLVYEYGSE